MENRKRPRLEASSTTLPLATHDGQSIFLSDADAATLPANVLFTICDANSDSESQDYLTIENSEPLAAHIKEEHDMSTQTMPAIQYQRTTVATSSSTNTQTNNGQFMQLPSGCQIYLVKGYVDDVATNTVTTAAQATPIKTEAGATLSESRQTIATAAGTAEAAEQLTLPSNGKRSFILEAYKKRDDKRRATHNEVERRRRDKINSWIFKLKEMLPTELPQNSNNANITTTTTTSTTMLTTTTNTASTTGTTTIELRATNNTNRTPPSDSKSQILIKACDYIKAMQQEIKSLRECLTENERLRLSNQRLQNELNKLKSEQQQQQLRGINNNLNITLNALNSSNGIYVVANTPSTHTATAATTTAATIVGSYNKKHELILRDYVD